MPLCHFSVPARPGHAGAGRCRVCRLRSGRRPPFLHSCAPALLRSCVVHAAQHNRCHLLHRLPPRNCTYRGSHTPRTARAVHPLITHSPVAGVSHTPRTARNGTATGPVGSRVLARVYCCYSVTKQQCLLSCTCLPAVHRTGRPSGAGGVGPPRIKNCRRQFCPEYNFSPGILYHPLCRKESPVTDFSGGKSGAPVLAGHACIPSCVLFSPMGFSDT